MVGRHREQLGSGGEAGGLPSADETVAEIPLLGLEVPRDLFDQLQLIRTLDLIGPGRSDRHSNVSLICIDRFPGVERFIGLGQLSDDQLATLVGTERPVTAGQYALASEAWAAFRSPDPRTLLALTVRLETDTAEGRALPFLRDALRRFLADFPSSSNGLSRTEELALDALREGGMTGGELFPAAQAEEERPFMGDSTFFSVLRALGSARVPLVTISNGPGGLDLGSKLFALTAAGREVVAGRRDHVAINGIDRWRGGVHLAGRDRSPWRWDARAETLVS